MVIGLLQSQQGGFCNGNPEGNEGRNGVTPSLQYHEKLVKVLCMNKRHDVVVNLIEDLERELDSMFHPSLVMFTLVIFFEDSRAF